jgi:hypothetical protein
MPRLLLDQQLRGPFACVEHVVVELGDQAIDRNVVRGGLPGVGIVSVRKTAMAPRKVSRSPGVRPQLVTQAQRDILEDGHYSHRCVGLP